jgi:small subunit ribosomal protein S4
MRTNGPKNRIARREGMDLNFKTAGSKAHSNLLKRLNIIPGEHGTARQKKLTDYGVQLREKQKLKRIYSITERQMSNYFDTAVKTLGNTGELFQSLLERRLDNVVYRLGFAPTRAAARQLVNHGHFTVNGKKVSIPSYRVKIKDIITFENDKTTKIPYIEANLAKKDIELPIWLQKKATTGKIVSMPDKESFIGDINLQLVVEFYSR